MDIYITVGPGVPKKAVQKVRDEVVGNLGEGAKFLGKVIVGKSQSQEGGTVNVLEVFDTTGGEVGSVPSTYRITKE